MGNSLIRLSKSCISHEEIAAVNAVMADEYLGMGKYVNEFETALKAYFNNNVGVTTSSRKTIFPTIYWNIINIGFSNSGNYFW